MPPGHVVPSVFPFLSFLSFNIIIETERKKDLERSILGASPHPHPSKAEGLRYTCARRSTRKPPVALGRALVLAILDNLPILVCVCVCYGMYVHVHVRLLTGTHEHPRGFLQAVRRAGNF